MPRLSTFIRENIEPILVEWEAFARALPPGDAMDISALRDHAKDILGVIARDLDLPQTAQEQSDKAKGESDADNSAIATAAQEHGAGRAESGFTVGQMMAEFRALRASVMRLWSQDERVVRTTDLQDMMRFNEAIDQAIAESITRYTHEIGQSKERFLAILGHDLRNPVGAIVTSTRFMLETNEQSHALPEPYLSLIDGISRSARRMSQMVADLLEFARVSFGDAIPIQRIPMDVGALVRDAVAEVRASYPDRDIRDEATGDLHGQWDFDRLFQALINLLGNAVQHGAAGAPIHVKAEGTPDAVCVSVRNQGPAIDEQTRARLFEGMNGAASSGERDRRHLGLGLYIVDKIVAAHGGTIDVQSSAEHGTVFTVRLPRATPEGARATNVH
jgi:signal transduction histidine kinase